MIVVDVNNCLLHHKKNGPMVYADNAQIWIGAIANQESKIT